MGIAWKKSKDELQANSHCSCRLHWQLRDLCVSGSKTRRGCPHLDECRCSTGCCTGCSTSCSPSCKEELLGRHAVSKRRLLGTSCFKQSCRKQKQVNWEKIKSLSKKVSYCFQKVFKATGL